jgi:hypothetical protein
MPASPDQKFLTVAVRVHVGFGDPVGDAGAGVAAAELDAEPTAGAARYQRPELPWVQ